MDETQVEGMVLRDHEQSTGDDEEHIKELLEDRIKCIDTELKIQEKELKRAKRKRKAQSGPRVSDKEPSREHLLLREAQSGATSWEKDMHAKYMAGQVGEMLGRIMEHINNKTDFPPSTEPYHKWTKELMDDARIGWHKHKILIKTLHKYPYHNAEQYFCTETEKWILWDRPELQKAKKQKMENDAKNQNKDTEGE